MYSIKFTGKFTSVLNVRYQYSNDITHCKNYLFMRLWKIGLDNKTFFAKNSEMLHVKNVHEKETARFIVQ